MKNKSIVFLLIIISVIVLFLLTRDSPVSVPKGASKIEGVVTRLRPNCQKSTYLKGTKVVEADEQSLCGGGSFITIGDTQLQYQTGLEPNGFWYDLDDIATGDKVTAVYVLENGRSIVNCDGCGIFK